MIFIFYIISGLIIFQLVLPFLTVLVAQVFGKERLGVHASSHPNRDYACIITAYKNAQIAIPLVQSLLKQSHPNLHVYLVADNCPPDFNTGLTDDRLSEFVPAEPLNLKAKSIIYAMDRYVRPHEYTVIFDADNLAHPKFLSTINTYADAGHRCIQGQRKAKNTENEFAAADSLGELYKNYIERYAPYLLGSSSVVSGSGMATETQLYRGYLDSPAIQEGQHQWKRMLQEDKILQNYLLMNGEKIVYARAAICFDEKVESADAVQTQRSRWLFSYFQNLPNTLKILAQGITTLNWNKTLFGLITLSLPMFIQLGVAFLLFCIGFFIAPPISVCIAIAVVIFATTVFWTLHLSGASAVGRRAITAIPAFIWRQLLALIKMGNPNKNFKHTEHKQQMTVEEVLKRDQDGEL
jgi:cellulose synthase/poly-beta-1,6-N-acetylglucosamine synthase-like glycosyltransferase